MQTFKLPIFIFPLTFLLNGCIGTALLRDADTTQPFPNLYTVPDAHPHDDIKDMESTIQQLEQQSNQNVNKNKLLRLKQGLSIEHTQSNSLFSKTTR
jgi:hypothetical protein